MAGISLSKIAEKIGQTAGNTVSKRIMPVILQNVQDIFRNEGGQEIKAKFLEAYDNLMAIEESRYPPFIKDKDPSALFYFRGVFIDQIDREIAASRVEGTNLIIEIGNKRDWGYGAAQPLRGEPDTPDVLSYYIEGVADTVGFISSKHYQMRRDLPSKGLGRFGYGFLISQARYEKEKWEKVTKIKFSDIKHPISGFPPYREFERVPEKIDFNRYFNLAVERAFRTVTG